MHWLQLWKKIMIFSPKNKHKKYIFTYQKNLTKNNKNKNINAYEALKTEKQYKKELI